MTGQRVGVAPRVPRLDVAQGRLGHECSQPGIVGFALEEGKLLVGDRQLGSEALEPLADVDETPLQDRLGHERNSLRARWSTGLGDTVTHVSTPHAIFTPEHDELRAAVRRFVEKELVPNVDEWEEKGYFPDWVFERCGELGFLGLHYPERWGGAGGDLAAEIVFVEELARCGAAAIAMAVSVQTDMATPALAEFGTDDQRERYLRPAIAGKKIAAIAITEPDAGSDVAGITTRGGARR